MMGWSQWRWRHGCEEEDSARLASARRVGTSESKRWAMARQSHSRKQLDVGAAIAMMDGKSSMVVRGKERSGMTLASCYNGHERNVVLCPLLLDLDVQAAMCHNAWMRCRRAMVGGGKLLHGTAC